MASVSSFQTISSIGDFSAGPFLNTATVGVYCVQINTIAIGDVSFTPTGSSSFVLTVIDPCLTAVMTSSTVSDANLNVFLAQALYSTFAGITYSLSIGSTACGTVNYIASEVPSS